MPYFVYHITIHPDSGAKILRHLDTYDKYKDARNFAREERGKMDPAPNEEIRMTFASTDVQAEKILSKPREKRVIGED